jgi:uncharacterized protein
VEELFPRFALSQIRDSLEAFRVVIVNGARQSGKSTLLAELGHGFSHVTLDDRQMLRAARTDPTGFLDSLGTPLAIDEVQRGGDPLVIAVKAAVDRRHRESGLYVLAGSSRFLTVPQLTESLAGRARIIELWPLSQAELERKSGPPELVEALFRKTPHVRGLTVQPEARRDVFGRIIAGGFPAIASLVKPALRRAWFENYVDTLVLRDLTELSRIRQGSDLPRLLRLLASRTAQEINISSLARDVQLGQDALRAYLMLLETIYLVFQLPAWSDSSTAVARRRPKLHFVDVGVASALLGASVESLLQPTSQFTGTVVESFAVAELARLRTFSATSFRMGHYRDKEQREVDLILESNDGRVVGVEVKSALDVDESDFRHLAYLRRNLGDRFTNGAVLYLGDHILPFGDRLTAVPISALWA